MASPRLPIVTLAAVCVCAAALAVEPPLPVSPGSIERIERIASPCPTFSWAPVPGVLGVRVAVYAIPADESAPPVLVTDRQLPAAASSWTPALPECLQPGTYAWGVGVVTDEGGPYWSEAAWFEVMAEGTALPGLPGAPGETPRERALTSGSGSATPEAGSGVRGRVEPRTPSRERLLATQFSVGSTGNVSANAVTATSFTGDGSGLTNLNATQLTSGTVPSGRLSGTYTINVNGTALNVTGLTQGGVTFGDGTGKLFQDPNNFFWDDTNNRLGLGTSAPWEQLQLTGNLRLPQTTKTPVLAGMVLLGPNTFMHAYHPTAGAMENTFLGYNAGNVNMGGSGADGTVNTGLGFQALQNVSTGWINTAVGAYTLTANTAGSHNTAAGGWALHGNTLGFSNTGIGAYALHSNTTASQNTAVGVEALRTLSFSNSNSMWQAANTAVGYRSLYNTDAVLSIDDGINNTAVGANSMYANTTGRANTAVGYSALRSNTTAVENVAVGQESLHGNTSSSGNTALGYQALYSQSYDPGALWWALNTAVGYMALEMNTPTSVDDAVHNTAVGALSMQNNTQGGYNAATGHKSLWSNQTGNENTANGDLSMRDNVSGHNNTAVGAGSLMTNQTGHNNTAIGWMALGNVATGQSGNVALGHQAGLNETTSNKLHIANNSASSLIWGDFATGQVIINNPGLPGSGALWVNGQIGASSLPLASGNPLCELGAGTGVIGTCGISDLRLKRDVQPLAQEIDILDTLSRLRGVAFNWDRSNEMMRNASERREIGMIAQEVEEVLPSLVTRDRDGYRSLDYAKLTAFLVEVAKAQQAEIEELRRLVATLTAKR